MKITPKSIADLFYPPLCVACDAVMPKGCDEPLCGICRSKWESAKSSAAELCGGTLVSSLELCGSSRSLDSFIASLVNYRPNTLERGFVVQQNIIFSLKAHNFKRLNAFITDEMVALINKVCAGTLDCKNTVIVSIPRNPKNYIKSANDGVKNIACSIASSLGASYMNLFSKSLFTREQKLLGRNERKKNGSGLYLREKFIPALAGRDVLLLDDVVTTGTTVYEAAMLLLELTQVRSIYVFSVAQSHRLA